MNIGVFFFFFKRSNNMKKTMHNIANKPTGPAKGIEFDFIKSVEKNPMYITVPTTRFVM